MKALVAGFGNIFFGDDGFGSELLARFAQRRLPDAVRAVDFGIRGLHAAFEMLGEYDLVVFADAVARGGAPGTLYVIEPDEMPARTPDAHAMELHNALALYGRLAAQFEPKRRPAIVVIGCEPRSTAEGIGLSADVEAALPAALELLASILSKHRIEVPSYESV